MKLRLFILSLVACVTAYTQEPDMGYLKGVAAIQKKEYQQAIDLFSQVSNMEKDNPAFFLKRGEAYFYLRDYDKAISDFKNADNLRTDYADLWLAKTYSQLNNPSLAVGFLKKHLGSVYRSDESVIKQDPAFDAIQNSNEWFELWQKNWYPENEKTIEQAKSLLAQKNTDRAMVLVNDALTGDPSDNRLKAVKAGIYFDQGNYKGTLSLMNQVIDVVKNNADYYVLRAKAYSAQQDYEAAIKDFNRAIGMVPESFGYYLDRSEAYLQQGNYNAALKDARFYLGLFSDDPKAIDLTARILMKQGNAVDALPYLSENIKNDPSKPQYFKARGDAYLQTKTYAYAVKDYSMALDLDPMDGDTYLKKGLARHYMGDDEGACSDWKKAKQFGNTRAIEYLLEYCK